MTSLVVLRCSTILCAVAGVTGCDGFSRGRDWSEPPTSMPPTPTVGVPAATDTRAPVVAAEAPPPVTGGTLLATADGTRAVIADPDRDRISFVDLERMALIGGIALERGDNPGRLVEGSDGRIFAVLRGRGSVLTLDGRSASRLDARDVCAAPRGIAFDAAHARLLVACAEGTLIELPPDGAATRTVELGGDLRDVVVTPERIAVTRFRSAELVELDADLNGIAERVPPIVHNSINSFDLEVEAFEPAVAWRAVAASDGSIFISHQRATSATIDIGQPGTGFTSAYGGGGGDPCGGIVQTGFTQVSSDGLVGTSPQLGGAVLPVDIAVSPDRDWVAIAVAGPQDPSAPAPFGPSLMTPESAPASEPRPAVLLLDPDLAAIATPDALCAPIPTMGQAPATAVAANPVTGDLLVQLRDPSQLIVIRDVASGGTLTRIDLNGDRPLVDDLRYDTGHELFHRAAGAPLACASCHPEGADDGRVWNFSGMGARRTQYLLAGLEGTAPFHWDGTLGDLGALMEDVMVGRMGGAHQTPERTDALARWLFGMPREQPDGADPTAAERGKLLFESSAGCAACHNGPKLTNNQTMDVGTGGPLQVPSLVGISRHPPFMHTGCAETLLERFDPACGGGAHGETADLTAEQQADLVAYLETL